MQVSVLILALNEEVNLPACLDALQWCDDIVVVDSGSTDATVEIAQERGARVLVRRFDNFASQRNFGLQHGNFRHSWVLHLDADEVVTSSFREALLRLQPGEDVDAFLVPSKLMFAGRWLKHAGMYPTYQVRLGRTGALRFTQVGHGQREDLPGYRLDRFPEPYLHYSFSHGLPKWFQKHIRYAQDEAHLLLSRRGRPEVGALFGGDSTARRRAAKKLSAIMPLFLRPVGRFFYVYVLKLGFLDGAPGLAYSMMISVYEAMMAIFVLERQLTKSSREADRPVEHADLQESALSGTGDLRQLELRLRVAHHELMKEER